MRHILLFCSLLLVIPCSIYSQTAPDGDELTKLLNDFLAGASRNDAKIHDRFWADDLIYTGSSGRRVSKADIMRDVTSAPPSKSDDPVTTFTAEDIRIHQYDSMAIVAFRLVGTTITNGSTRISNYLNTGTFLKRNGEWRVIGWQATKKPKPEEELKKEVMLAAYSLCRAISSADTVQIKSLTDESFIFAENGKQSAQQELLGTASKIKFTLPEGIEPAISVFGETSIVRYASKTTNTSVMLTFINSFGEWKAVAMDINTLIK